jgi:ABC-2 type transport system permease protein
MYLSTAAKYVTLTLDAARFNLKCAMEYRMNFIVQVLGMVINDLAFVVLWWLFFERFDTVRGWGFKESLLLFSYGATAFGLCFYFAGGAFQLARIISEGSLDSFLTLPRSVIWQVCVSKSDIAALGDIVFGLGAFVMTQDVSLEGLAMYLVCSTVTAAMFLSFIILTQSIAFYVGEFKAAAEDLFHMLLGFSIYPATGYDGALRVVVYTVLPAGFMLLLPIDMIQKGHWRYLGVMILALVVLAVTAGVVFARGLRRYESGNLISAKL